MSDDRTRSDPAYFALKDALRIANLRIAELEKALGEITEMSGGHPGHVCGQIARAALDGKGSDPIPSPSVPERDGEES